MTKDKEIVRQVGDIYKWLDEQLTAKFTCNACGKCCDFDSFGHRLYVTTPEMLYLADKLTSLDVIARSSDLSERRSNLCPYQIDAKCTVYQYRFASCRIFCCKGDTDFQSELTETVIKKFKTLCDEFQIPYRYVDLLTALNTFLPSNDS